MPVGAIIGGATSLIGGIMGSNAADEAAAVQSQAAEKARALIEKNQNAALDFAKGVWSGTQENQQPFLDVGTKGADYLSGFLDTPFKAPTLEELRATPGYQFQLEQGIGALDKSAAARGTLFSGTQGTELEKFAGGLADSTYGDAYNRAMTEYMNRYGILRDTTGMGMTTATNLANEGIATAGQVGDINRWGAEDQAQQLNNAAAARASGYINTANAWGNAIPGMAKSVMQGVDWWKQQPSGSDNQVRS